MKSWASSTSASTDFCLHKKCPALLNILRCVGATSIWLPTFSLLLSPNTCNITISFTLGLVIAECGLNLPRLGRLVLGWFSGLAKLGQ
jgi:hypothetical protein